MPLRPRPEIDKLASAFHGGPDHAELGALGFKPEDVMDFSVCSNPYMSPPDLSSVLDSREIGLLPDSGATVLREALAGKLGVSPSSILVGNGSTELIRLVALAYFGRGDSVLILEPTFGEYSVSCKIAGADVAGLRAGPDAAFSHSAGGIVDSVAKAKAKGVFICNPNNPTGSYLSRKEIETVLDGCPDSLIVLDEAYLAFVDKSWSSLDLINRGNLVILRSMTKDYALGGLRLGYAVAREDMVEILRRISPPWNVNIVAQKAGVAVLGDEAAIERSLGETKRAREFLLGELRRIGLDPLPSATHFFLVKVGDARGFRNELLKQGMIVRDCASFGLPEHVRIAARTLPECRKLVAAIRAMKEKSGSDAAL